MEGLIRCVFLLCRVLSGIITIFFKADDLGQTVSVMRVFMLAMVLYPEVQRKAQAELDAVVGIGRLPSFGDREDLPYLDALCKEVYRWHPIVPFGVAHKVMQDDVYGDLFIPGGSIVFGNAWCVLTSRGMTYYPCDMCLSRAMLHNEKVYGPEPMEFRPERFMGPGAKEPISAFGFGRR